MYEARVPEDLDTETLMRLVMEKRLLPRVLC